MKLKKKYANILKLIILLLIITIIIIIVMRLIKKDHVVDYKINNYNIHEKFYIKDKKHYYEFVIKDSKDIFVFNYKKNVHKKKRIIKKIIVSNYKKNKCIMPIYRGNNKGNILCKYDKSVVSIDFFKNVDSKAYKKVLNDFKKSGYTINMDNSDNIKKYKKLLIYKDNIKKNELYSLWNYKGLYVIKNNDVLYKKLLKEDKYENELATLVGKYYVFIDTNNKYNGFKLYYYDINKNKLKKLDKTKYKIDDDIVFSGTYDNKLYMYDKKYKKQYLFDPYKGELKLIGNKSKGFYLLKNNNLDLVNYYEFKDILYFNYSINDEEIVKLYNAKNIYLLDNYYYIYSNEGYFYKVYIDNINSGIILFRMEDISSYIIRDDNIIFTKGDSLYKYNDYDGLVNVIKYDELDYNYNNIYDYYEKN